jgi:hypothetical protein
MAIADIKPDSCLSPSIPEFNLPLVGLALLGFVLFRCYLHQQT